MCWHAFAQPKVPVLRRKVSMGGCLQPETLSGPVLIGPVNCEDCHAKLP